MLQPPGAAGGTTGGARRAAHTNRRKTQESPDDIIRQLQRIPPNKKCCDCSSKLPNSVNLSIGSFVCTTCAGIHRALNARVKGIGASSFTVEEAERMKQIDNDQINAIYMARYNPHLERLRRPIDNADPQLLRAWIHRKYQDRAWYDPNAAAAPAAANHDAAGTTQQHQQQQYGQPTMVQIPPKQQQQQVDLLGSFSGGGGGGGGPTPQQPPASAPAAAGGWNAFGQQQPQPQLQQPPSPAPFEANFSANFAQLQQTQPQQQPPVAATPFPANFGSTQTIQQQVNQPPPPTPADPHTQFHPTNFDPQLPSPSSQGQQQQQAGLNFSSYSPTPQQQQLQQQQANLANFSQQQQQPQMQPPQQQQQLPPQGFANFANFASPQMMPLQQQAPPMAPPPALQQPGLPLMMPQPSMTPHPQGGFAPPPPTATGGSPYPMPQQQQQQPLPPPQQVQLPSWQQMAQPQASMVQMPPALPSKTVGGGTLTPQRAPTPGTGPSGPSPLQHSESSSTAERPVVKPADARFRQGQAVVYKSASVVGAAQVVKVHLDDDLVPFYTVQINGKEKQTDALHLTEKSSTLADLEVLLMKLSEPQLMQVQQYVRSQFPQLVSESTTLAPSIASLDIPVSISHIAAGLRAQSLTPSAQDPPQQQQQQIENSRHSSGKSNTNNETNGMNNTGTNQYPPGAMTMTMGGGMMPLNGMPHSTMGTAATPAASFDGGIPSPPGNNNNSTMESKPPGMPNAGLPPPPFVQQQQQQRQQPNQQPNLYYPQQQQQASNPTQAQQPIPGMPQYPQQLQPSLMQGGPQQPPSHPHPPLPAAAGGHYHSSTGQPPSHTMMPTAFPQQHQQPQMLQQYPPNMPNMGQQPQGAPPPAARGDVPASPKGNPFDFY